jgi:hypothetical protein
MNFLPDKTDNQIAILKTVVFFDLFDYPLTVWEIWQYLSVRIELETVEQVLAGLLKQAALQIFQGFVFMPGRSEIVMIRRQRYNYTNHKFLIAKRVARLFALLPSVKLVAVSNLIGHHNLRAGSDIDIFIMASPNRLWLTRFFCAGLMKLFFLRPTKKSKVNKICLSFYVTTSGADLEPLRLGTYDPYFDHWLLGLYPLHDKDEFLPFLRAQNTWLKEAFPNSLLLSKKSREPEFKKSWIERIFFRLGDLSEKITKKIQWRIMPVAIKSLIGHDGGVVITPDVLKFYLQDRRLEFLNKYRVRLARLGIYEKN